MPLTSNLAKAEHLALVHGSWVIHPASRELPLRIEIPAGMCASVMEDGSGPACEVLLGKDASLEWVRWQHELSQSQTKQKITLAEGSQLKWTNVQFGCDEMTNPVAVELRGKGAAAHLHGISFGQKSESVENQICVEHLAPNTASAQLFKSVLRDQAKSTFAGKIVIRREAQKSDAKQRHQSLNFHSTAQSITRPELEIEADDVKAAHGATVGRLDEEELFYLQTRGISRADSMALLARAFVQEVLGTIKNESIYAFVDQQLGERIGEFLQAMERES
jgi:Fe-S cluster assembly protein SufD